MIANPGLLTKIKSALNIFDTPDASRVLVLDTSHWTHKVDFAVAKERGIKGVIIKAMDGAKSDTQPGITAYFTDNYRGAVDNGLMVGAYSWLYRSANISAGRQARAFAYLLKDYPLDIPPVVDFEWTKFNGVASNPNSDDLTGFGEPFAERFGRYPMIYTAYWYWKEYGKNLPYWTQYELWQAEYGVDAPRFVPPWNETYKLWQFTASADARYYGVPADGEKEIDMNYYNGTLAEFMAWCGKSVEPPPDPDPEPTNIVPISEIISVNPLPTVPIDIHMRTWIGPKAYDQALTFTPVITPPPPPPPPVTTDLYLVDPAKWPVNHDGMSVPPEGGPLTQYLSSTPKKGDNLLILTKQWQDYIRRWNTQKDYERICAWDFGPTKGFNDKGNLKYLGLAYPGDNVVKIKSIVSGWGLIESIPLDILPDDTKISPVLTPWLFHRVRGSSKPAGGWTDIGNYIIPILGNTWYVPMSALTKK